MSPTALCLIAGLIAVFPLTAPAVPLINLVGGGISIIASTGILVSDSVIPSSYVWVAILIFVISCFPLVRRVGRSLSVMLIGKDPNNHDVNLGDALIGSIATILYNYRWLEFASNNDGSWLIYFNWFLGWIELWSFFAFVVLSKSMRGRL